MSNPKSFMSLLGDAFKGGVEIAYKGTKLGVIGIGYTVGIGKQIVDDIIEGIDEGQKLSLSKDEEKDATVIHDSSVTEDDLLAMARQEMETQFANWKQKPGNEHKEFSDFQAEFHELFHPEEMKA